MRIAVRFWKLALAISASAMSISCFAMPANSQEMQALLQKQVDLEQRDRFAVIPVYPDDAGRSLAHAVLDELGKQPAYRQAMDKWLAENSALTQEDLLKGWFRHYHTVIRSEIFDFLAPDDLALLWKIMGKNALYALNRSECQGLSAQQLGDVINQERVKLIAQNKKRIAAVFALAVGQELQREQQPESGARRPPKVSQALVMHSFQKMKALWPQRDQEILHEAFSYKQNPVQRSAAEECDRNWLVSHAIADSASQGIPFLLESVTTSKYSSFFDTFDAPFAMSRPTPVGFVPGKASVHYPELPLRRGVQGKTTARVTVNPAGDVTDVQVIDDSLSPASITSGDGRVFSSKTIFQAMIHSYFKAGKFPAQPSSDQPKSFDLTFSWRLSD